MTEFQEEFCTSSRWEFSDLRAVYVNCTLKPSPELSNTAGLMRISMAIMERNGVGSTPYAPPIMSWRMLKDAGGMPAHGNQRSLWDAGCRFDFANPDYR